MAKSIPVVTEACVVCGNIRVCACSLRITRKKGKWGLNPVCPDCRRELIEEAKAAKRFVPFFRIDNSLKEIKKRNEKAMRHKPFLEKFGQKPRRKQGKKPSRPKAKT